MDGSTAKEASEGEEQANIYIYSRAVSALACLAGMPVRLVFFLAGKPLLIVACLSFSRFAYEELARCGNIVQLIGLLFDELSFRYPSTEFLTTAFKPFKWSLRNLT